MLEDNMQVGAEGKVENECLPSNATALPRTPKAVEAMVELDP
jgi:hypothetical protein